jgi:DNA-binding transcriptional regulator YdaS (Cro superfamily)
VIVAAIIDGMTKTDALKHFGSQKKLADALGIKQPSVCNWGAYPPYVRQVQIQILTGGKLKPELLQVFATVEPI